MQEGLLLLQGLPEEALEDTQVRMQELAIQGEFKILNGVSCFP